MKMHALSGGRLRMKKHIFYADAERQETVDLPIACYLMRHGQGNVLFDTGCHPKIGTDPEERWGAMARALVPVHNAGDHVVASLADVGLAPEDIDVVVNSHLHSDHCGCNEFFTQATFVVHEKELATAQDPAMEGQGYFRADWDLPMPVEAVTGERDLFNDGRIVLVPLAGHSPGMMGALVGLDRDGAFFLASDTVSMRDNLDSEFLPKNTWNKDLLTQAYAEVRKIEAGGATVVCGHDAAQWDAMRHGRDAYE